jgi:hypothetical protein
MTDDRAQSTLALVELLHPGGVARRPLMVTGGDALPEEPSAPVDVLVLAAGAQTAQAAAAAARVPADGVAYVVAPPHVRIRLLRVLAREGLRPVAAFVHVRGASDVLLVQLDRRAARYAVSALVRPTPLLCAAARVLTRPVAIAAVLIAPRVGVALTRRESPPIAAWIAADGDRARPALVLHATRTRESSNELVYVFGNRQSVVKVRDGKTELRQLERFGAAAARAGAVVSDGIDLDGGPPGAAAVTLLDGTKASSVIARRPSALEPIVHDLTRWLQRWNVDTARQDVVTRALLEDEVLGSARLLEATIADGGRYRAWLEERSRAWVGVPLPLVKAHQDLTMANVLVTRDGGIAVLDWVQARERALPLVDFFYAVADAAAAVGGYRDRAAAFRSCFTAGGPTSTLVRDCELALTTALHVSPPVRELCFHACWLHHAANELRKGAVPVAPFLAIVEVVAAEAGV